MFCNATFSRKLLIFSTTYGKLCNFCWRVFICYWKWYSLLDNFGDFISYSAFLSNPPVIRVTGGSNRKVIKQPLNSSALRPIKMVKTHCCYQSKETRNYLRIVQAHEVNILCTFTGNCKIAVYKRKKVTVFYLSLVDSIDNKREYVIEWCPESWATQIILPVLPCCY